MQDIGAWLSSIGMSEYAQRFAENDVDEGALPHLTEQHLKDLGISLGHRVKMLRAIAQLAGAAPITPQPVIEPKPQNIAERRQLTVMFCDLVGSTALSARLDPEDLRAIIGAYHRCCAELVERNGGFVAKYMGDGVLAYFGYPQAHEHDAERAVRAGLALVEVVPKLKTAAGVPLPVRIGIATGLVVVGDLIGAGAAQEQAVVGETPNLAARLQASADPGAVVIASSTRRLIGGLFEYRDLGAVALKGLGESVPAWQVLGASAAESRFEALRATTTPLVGRDEEIDLLKRRWEQAKRRDGQVVLISGEPGIGKSRIAQTLLERLSGEPHTRLRYFCSPHHQDSALYPSITQLERAAGFRREDTPEQRLSKLEAVLAQATNDLSEAVPLLADLLSIPPDKRYPPLNLTPQNRKEKTLHTQLAQVEGLAERQPVLMVFEDVHWSDPTTRESLDLLIDRLTTLRVLVIITFRPEFSPPWVGRPHVTMLTLNRLPPRQRAEMITNLTGGKPLPKEIYDQIVDRTDGVPLFIEELTKTVVDSGIIAEAGNEHAWKGPVAPLVIPTTLHGSLLARLDRIAPTRELAQIGAALGRQFSHELISAVSMMPKQQLEKALDQLVAAELIFRRGTAPDAQYTFKHALVQDAAYSTLLRSRRQQIHACIAETLERQFGDIAQSQPELLAHHCTEAGLIEKAASYWGKAGQRSLGRSALAEAAAQLSRALGQIATLPSTITRRREQIKFQVAFANALMHKKGYAAPETKAALDQGRLYIEQAEALGEPPEDPLLLFSVLYGFWVANHNAFNGEICCDLAAQFLVLAERQQATIPRMMGHRIMGRSLLDTGKLVEGRAHCDHALALYAPAEHRSLAMRFGQEAGVAILSFRSLGLWLLGHPDAALADADRAVKNAREIGHPATLMFALAHVPLTYIHCGHYGTARAQADEVAALADQKGSVLWKSTGTMYRGCVLALTGKTSDAIQMINSGFNAWRSTGATLWTPFYLSCLARTYAELHELDDAWHCIEEAIAAVERTKERWCEAEAHRIAGEVALRAPEPDTAKAESYFRRALAIARAQEAKSWELRAAMNTARLWRDQGKERQAFDLLAPIYGWFTEGVETRDLKEAKGLLCELG